MIIYQISIKTFTDEKSDEGYFVEVDIEYPKTLWGSYKDLLYHFYLKEEN